MNISHDTLVDLNILPQIKLDKREKGFTAQSWGNGGCEMKTKRVGYYFKGLCPFNFIFSANIDTSTAIWKDHNGTSMPSIPRQPVVTCILAGDKCNQIYCDAYKLAVWELQVLRVIYRQQTFGQPFIRG